MYIGTLPHVECCQMETENIDCRLQKAESEADDQFSGILVERIDHDLQIGAEFFR